MKPILCTRVEAAAACCVPIQKWDAYVRDNGLADARVYRGRRAMFLVAALERHCAALPRVRQVRIGVDEVNAARGLTTAASAR